MPLYEYVCKRCSHAFEELVFGGPSPSCPACDAPDAERVLPSRVAAGRSQASAVDAVAPCGRCGDPRGPGACGS